MVERSSLKVPPGAIPPGTGTDMRALTGVLPGPDGPLPLLILDQRPQMTGRTGPAERVNLFVAALLSMGLTLVTTISEPAAQPDRASRPLRT
jgi:hypothetical protein